MEAHNELDDATTSVAVDAFDPLGDQHALLTMELLKAELLATVSHELRSPLASIKGYAATLLRHERRISREERHQFLLAIKGASDRLEAVIDRLLEMSQWETGAIALHCSAVDLGYLVREAITSLQRRLEVSAGEERLVESPPRLSVTLYLMDEASKPAQQAPIIQADRQRLREVLDHLFENALKYSPQGGVIDVVVHPLPATTQTIRAPQGAGTSEPNNMVEICVRDHGMGIPESHLERIFDRYHRVDTRLTREVGGMGLGLAICKRVVELHGGRIWAESKLGTGSSFYIWLPIDAPSSSL